MAPPGRGAVGGFAGRPARLGSPFTMRAIPSRPRPPRPRPPRPGPTLLVPLVLAVVLLAACGGEQTPPSTPPQGTPPASPAPERIPTDAPQAPLDRPTPAPDPLTSAPPTGGVALAAARVEAAGLPPGFPTLVWIRGDTTLGIYGRAGGCTEARAEVVAQDAARVEVRVVQERTSPDPCTRDLRYPPLEVRLDAPLAERRVVLRGEVR